MKTMKAKIIGLILGMTILLCGTLGAMNIFENIATANDVLKQNMTETAKLAASRIEKELEITKQIATETGTIARLSEPNVSIEEKNAIIQQKIKDHNFLGGNLLDSKGISVLDGSDVYKDRDYFLSAIKGDAFISGPVVSRVTGEYSVLISAPVWKGGVTGSEIAGVVYFKPDLNMFSQIVSTINIGKTGASYIINKEGLVFAHNDQSIIYKYNANEEVKKDPSLAKVAQIEQDMMAGNTGYNSYDKDGATYVQAYAPIKGTDGWSVGVYAQQNEFLGNVRFTILLTVVISAIFLMLGIVTSVIFTKKVLKPVNVAAQHLTKMAKGETLEPLDEKTFKGEFRPIAKSYNEVRETLYKLLEDTGSLANAAISGDLSVRADASRHQGGYRDIIDGINRTLDAVIAPVQESSSVLEELSKGNLNVSVTGNYNGDHALIKNALNDTIDTLKNYIGEISLILGQMSEGNLTVGITADYKGNFIELKSSLNRIIQSLNTMLTEINTAAEQVANGTKQVSDGSQAISQGAAEQASSIEQLTVSISQIAAQTRQNADNAKRANELANTAKDNAERGNEQMKGMQKAMEEINEASANIGKIIKVIDDIAFQTNILALNAAVEAARAGVHGKGFAVVAEEVRNLAARCANAAKETTTLIEGSIEKAEAGTKIANETASALTGIVKGVENAVTLMGEIAVASDEQATSISQVNRGIEQMSQVVQTNSTTSEETAAASEELSGQAELLESMVGQFKLKSLDGRSKLKMIKIGEDGKSTNEASKLKIALDSTEFGKY